MASIAFDSVSKVFPDGTRAVDGLDLEIADGEFTVLVDGEKLIGGGPLGFVGVLPSVRTVRELVEQRLRAASP